MSELDDLISKADDEAAARQKRWDLRADHGDGYEAFEVGADIRGVVDDFVRRIPDDAGVHAYWIRRDNRVTVHLPPEGIPFLSGYTKEHKKHLRRRKSAWKADRRGDARVLRLAVPQNDGGDDKFFFVRLNGAWVPARSVDGGDSWSWPRDLQKGMVDFLRGVRYRNS